MRSSGGIALLAAASLAAAWLLAACTPSRTPGGAPETGGPATPSAAPTTSVGTTPSVVTTSFAANAPWPRLTLVRRWSGLAQPVYLTTSDADSGTVFIVEKGGRVRVARDDVIDPKPFLDLSNKVSTGSEQGLLSVAFPTGAASAERMYACYTADNGDVVVSRFSRGPTSADAGSEREVLRVPHSAHPNHNGGGILFGPDGMLYVGIGDGGSEGDPNGYGQDLGVLLAKLLRIDVEGVSVGGTLPATYLVPRDNPFVGRKDARPETWAWGLRNPWRFSFDAATRDLYIGDVGQDKWEEIDFQPAGSRGGQDYGWSIMEGFHPYRGGSTAGLTPPVTEYGHDLGNAVVSGYAYRGRRWPKLQGVYLFGDDGSGRVWGMRREGDTWRTRQLLSTSYAISSFGQDAAGELYLLDLAGGDVYEVRAP